MFDKLKQGFARYALKALKIENNYSIYNDFNSYGTVQNRMLEIMSNCTEGINGSMNPREWITLSDICYIEIPIVQRAIQKSAELVGRVYAFSNLPTNAETQKTVDAANYFIENCPLLKEETGTPVLKTGLNNLSYQIVETCHRRGMCFLEERFDDSGNFIGVLRYNSKAFYYQKTELNRSELYYNQQKVDVSSPFFQLLGLEFEDGYDWGKCLLYGGAWSSELFVRVVNAGASSATRHANPATLTLIANNDPQAFATTKNEAGENVLTPISQMWANIVSSIKSSVLRGLKDMSNGKGSHTVVSVPGKDLTITSQTYGDGIAGGGVDKDTYDFFTNILANALNMPLEIFSMLVSGGGGFSGERFKMIMESQGNRVTATRNDLAPILLHIIKNELRRRGFNPTLIDSIQLEWLYNDFETELEKAEVAKIYAETAEKVINVWEKIYMVSPEAANKYAAENGIIIE